MRILIGTKNPGKIEGANQAFKEYFDDVGIIGIPVESEVGDEPINDDIYLGAKNRVKNLEIYAKENNINADYFLAVESGMTNKLGKWMIVNIAVIKDKNGLESLGSSQGFPVPDKYVEEIRKTDLGKVMDNIFNKTELRAGKGGISLLTHNKISRIDLTKNAFMMALTEFINGEIWK